ncbi:CapA family protein [Bacillus cereus]|uniref:Capsular biosynthesis protein n=2 Tax=Bacillus cereus group TaxID=86661 RepID=A0A9X7B598_BACCE|nr:CapA family protein [Bacillus cereus]PED41232.1 capsular biosynthesis protein [Bacillus cereus]PFU99767.1 capsular biosynthesis protein [Bacillus cereus]
MKKNLTFQEKLLAFSKKTKKKNTLYTLTTLLGISIALICFSFFERTKATESIAANTEAIFTMTMVGDVMMGRNIKEISERYGPTYVFRYTLPYFENSDYVSGNFENPVLLKTKEQYEKAEKYIHLETQRQAVVATKEAGFTILNLANNHMMDYGEKGLRDTLQVFKEENLDYIGAGENLTDAKNIVYQDLNGVRVASLGFTDAYVDGFIATKEQAGVLNMNPDIFFELIRKAKKSKEGNADLVIVNAHWGDEYDTEANPRQKALAKAMVDAGADIIIGHHPHVLQSFEVYKNSIIFYSLGNFIFDQGWTRTKDSALVQYHLQNNGLAKVEIVPLKIKEGTPRPVAGWWDTERINRQLTKKTKNESIWNEKEGMIEITVNHQRILNHKNERANQSQR